MRWLGSRSGVAFGIGRLEWQVKLLAALSLAAVTYVQFAIPLFWGSGDPLDHLRIARYITGQPEGMLIPWRPPGMALFMILMGVTSFDTFKGLVAAYALMAFALPGLVYMVVRPYNRNAALTAGSVSVLSGYSVAYARVLFPEQLFHFLHLLAIVMIGAWLARPDRRLLPYAIAITIFALNLVRPVAALYFWIFLACALLLVRRPIRHTLIAALVYVTLNAGWALVDRYYGASVFPTVYAPTTQNQRMLGEIYFSTDQLHFVEGQPQEPVVRAEDGEYSRKLCEALESHVRKTAPAWSATGNPEIPPLLFGRYSDEPEALVHAVLSRPNFAYWNFLRTALYAELGPALAEKTMRRVAREQGNTGIGGVLAYFGRNPSKLLTGGMPSFGGRNLLGIFYYTRLRQNMNRIYSASWGETSIDPEALARYQETPSRETLEALYARKDEDGLRLIDPENGPATTEFFRATDLMIRAYPMYWEEANSWFSPYKGRPDEFLHQVLDPRPPYHSGMYEGFYWEALIRYYGIGAADRLFSRVALETLHAYPYSATIFLDNAIRIMFIRTIGDLKSPGWPPPYDSWGDLRYAVRVNDMTGLSPALAAELRPRIEGTPWSDAVAKAYATGHLVSPVFVVTALAFFVPALLSPARRIAVFLLLAYLCDVAVISVFGNFGCPRYSDMFNVLPVMLTCLGTDAAIRIYRVRHRLSPTD